MKIAIGCVVLGVIGALVGWPMRVNVAMFIIAALLGANELRNRSKGRFTGEKALWWIPAAVCFVAAVFASSPLALFLAACFAFMAQRQRRDDPMPDDGWASLGLKAITIVTLGVGVCWIVWSAIFGTAIEAVIWGVDHGTPAWHRFWGG